MEIKIPFKTPSINHLYGSRGYRKYLKPEAKKLREEITEIIYDFKAVTIDEYRDKKLMVGVEIYEDWLTKKGEVKRKDVSNREKFLIDSVFDALGIDDKFIYSHTMSKVQSDKEFAIVRISEMEKEEQNE